jgi:hypothetical protein
VYSPTCSVTFEDSEAGILMLVGASSLATMILDSVEEEEVRLMGGLAPPADFVADARRVYGPLGASTGFFGRVTSFVMVFNNVDCRCVAGRLLVRGLFAGGAEVTLFIDRRLADCAGMRCLPLEEFTFGISTSRPDDSRCCCALLTALPSPLPALPPPTAGTCSPDEIASKAATTL